LPTFDDADTEAATAVAKVANDTPYGLGAGIWTRDISKAHALAKRIRAGTVDQLLQHLRRFLPFGGYKQSGWGREMGHQVLAAYTEVKSVCAQL
jgi:phenylacetaldehyde dehydrogenase